MKYFQILIILFIFTFCGNLHKAQMPPPPGILTVDFSTPKEVVTITKDFKVFPQEILKWNIRDLRIIGEKEFNKIPEEIKNLQFLENFSMSGGTGVTALPEEFSKLKSLKKIFIFSNYITVFPSQILELKNLEVLEIICPVLQAYPQDLGKLENLKQISLSADWNRTAGTQKQKPLELPKSIKNLKKVEFLYISSNGFKQIPAEIGEMENVKMLTLANNDLESLPQNFSKLKNLNTLDLSRNSFKSFPTALYGLENVERLDYNNNELETVPKGIERMKSLKAFFASKNKISASALVELYKIPNLEILDISNCEIEKIPAGIEKMKYLKKIYVYGNKISEADMQSLKKLVPNTKIVDIAPLLK